MASRIPVHARIVATDLNQPMLDHARLKLIHDGRITWRQADAPALPFTDQSFDVVACQFGVMFFLDKPRGYREARRVLRPGGHFFFTAWDRISENELADSVTEALAAMFPRDPPRFLARTPTATMMPNKSVPNCVLRDWGMFRSIPWMVQVKLLLHMIRRWPGYSAAE
jgi:ubiquinone/menaquinone biosynthesis C-methylase UbiE